MARRVHAVVLNYNQAEAALQAVAELGRAQGVDVDVLVVDAASNADDVARLRRGVSPERLLLLPANLGYAGGMNAGMRFWRDADAGVPVLLATPDARVGEDVVARLLDVLESDPGVAAAGPVVVYSRGPRPRIGAGGALDPRHARIRLLPEARSAEPYDVDWIEGCCMLLRPEAVESVGGLDEAYFLYYEEIDLCHRLVTAGWRVRVAPGASVLHPKRPGGQPKHYFYYMTRNGYRFWRRNFGLPGRRQAVTTLHATLWHALLAAGSLVLPGRWNEAPARVRDLWFQAVGAWSGTRDHLRGRYGPRRGPTPDPGSD